MSVKQWDKNEIVVNIIVIDPEQNHLCQQNIFGEQTEGLGISIQKRLKEGSGRGTSPTTWNHKGRSKHLKSSEQQKQATSSRPN